MTDPNHPDSRWTPPDQPTGEPPEPTESPESPEPPRPEPASQQPLPPPSAPYDGPSTPPPPHPPQQATEGPATDRRRGRLAGPILAAVIVSALVSAAVTLGLADLGEETAEAERPVGDQVADEPDDDLTGETPDDTAGTAEGSEIADIADQIVGTVARVDVEAPGAPDGLDMPGEQPGGTGSAVVYREDGYLITNAHVVGDASTTQVTLADGTQAEAEVVGTFQPNDLAVLQVLDEDVSMSAAPFADQSPRVGETAIAVGSPFGLDATVTSGIISATGRTLEAPDGQVLPDMLQTDAAINMGNSGGALVDAAGNVVGINTAILGSGPQGGNIGIGFAVPAQIATSIADQLIEDGVVSYAQLGVVGNDLPPAGAEDLGIPGGALVQDVDPDGAAEGVIEPGDVVIAVDDEEVEGFADLAAEIRVREPGDPVEITLLRDDEELTVEVELGEARDG